MGHDVAHTQREMSSPARSVLTLWRLPTTEEVWIRVLGLLLMVVGGYYLYAGVAEVSSFIRMTIAGRLALAVGLTVFVFLRLAPSVFLVVALVDLLGALWTGRAFRRAKANTQG
jgi:hypothetical protein